MNKEIKELFMDALSITLNSDDPDGDISDMYIPECFAKTFAELIIQQCLSLAQSHSSQNEDYAAGIDAARESIRAYFLVSDTNIVQESSNWIEP